MHTVAQLIFVSFFIPLPSDFLRLTADQNKMFSVNCCDHSASNVHAGLDGLRMFVGVSALSSESFCEAGWMYSVQHILLQPEEEVSFVIGLAND